MNLISKAGLALGLGAAITLAAPAGELHTDHIQSQTYTVHSDAQPTSINREAFTVADYKVHNITVNITGKQAAIDMCNGPVYVDYGQYGQVITEHNHCGGDYVLALNEGDHINITGYGAGNYKVVGSIDVAQGTKADVLNPDTLYLQTCYYNSNTMRLVALEGN